MTESRAGLVRSVENVTVFAQTGHGDLGILQDEAENASNSSGFILDKTAHITPCLQTRVSRRGGGLGTPRSRIAPERKNAYGSTSVTRGLIGKENVPVQSALRERCLLPDWYPRVPLRDITAVVRAIERIRANFGEVERLHLESPMLDNQRVGESSVPLSCAPLEHAISTVSPNPTLGVKQCLFSVKVPKMLLDITDQSGGELESLSSQRKLVNSIDQVEKVMTEELNKLKRIPSSKKAEREKRVHTLMSMR